MAQFLNEDALSLLVKMQERSPGNQQREQPDSSRTPRSDVSVGPRHRHPAGTQGQMPPFTNDCAPSRPPCPTQSILKCTKYSTTTEEPSGFPECPASAAGSTITCGSGSGGNAMTTSSLTASAFRWGLDLMREGLHNLICSGAGPESTAAACCGCNKQAASSSPAIEACNPGQSPAAAACCCSHQEADASLGGQVGGPPSASSASSAKRACCMNHPQSPPLSSCQPQPQPQQQQQQDATMLPFPEQEDSLLSDSSISDAAKCQGADQSFFTESGHRVDNKAAWPYGNATYNGGGGGGGGGCGGAGKGYACKCCGPGGGEKGYDGGYGGSNGGYTGTGGDFGGSSAGYGSSNGGFGGSSAGLGASGAGFGSTNGEFGGSGAGLGTSSAGCGCSNGRFGSSRAGFGGSGAGLGASGTGLGASGAGYGSYSAGIGSSGAGLGASGGGFRGSGAGLESSGAGLGTSGAGFGSSNGGFAASASGAGVYSGGCGGSGTGYGCGGGATQKPLKCEPNPMYDSFSETKPPGPPTRGRDEYPPATKKGCGECRPVSDTARCPNRRNALIPETSNTNASWRPMGCGSALKASGSRYGSNLSPAQSLMSRSQHCQPPTQKCCRDPSSYSSPPFKESPSQYRNCTTREMTLLQVRCEPEERQRGRSKSSGIGPDAMPSLRPCCSQNSQNGSYRNSRRCGMPPENSWPSNGAASMQQSRPTNRCFDPPLASTPQRMRGDCSHVNFCSSVRSNASCANASRPLPKPKPCCDPMAYQMAMCMVKAMQAKAKAACRPAEKPACAAASKRYRNIKENECGEQDQRRLWQQQVDYLVCDQYYPGIIHDTIRGCEDFERVAYNVIAMDPSSRDRTGGQPPQVEPMSLLEAFQLRVDYERKGLLEDIRGVDSKPTVSHIDEHYSKRFHTELNEAVAALFKAELLANQLHDKDALQGLSFIMQIDKSEVKAPSNICPDPCDPYNDPGEDVVEDEPIVLSTVYTGVTIPDSSGPVAKRPAEVEIPPGRRRPRQRERERDEDGTFFTTHATDTLK